MTEINWWLNRTEDGLSCTCCDPGGQQHQLCCATTRCGALWALPDSSSADVSETQIIRVPMDPAAWKGSFMCPSSRQGAGVTIDKTLHGPNTSTCCETPEVSIFLPTGFGTDSYLCPGFFAFPEWYKIPISLKETLLAVKVGLFLGKMLSWCVLLLL